MWVCFIVCPGLGPRLAFALTRHSILKFLTGWSRPNHHSASGSGQQQLVGTGRRGICPLTRSIGPSGPQLVGGHCISSLFPVWGYAYVPPAHTEVEWLGQPVVGLISPSLISGWRVACRETIRTVGWREQVSEYVQDSLAAQTPEYRVPTSSIRVVRSGSAATDSLILTSESMDEGWVFRDNKLRGCRVPTGPRLWDSLGNNPTDR